jgi:hypothetical protein
MLRSAGAGWTALSTARYPGTLEVLANSDQLGVFVAATSAGGGVVFRAALLAAGFGLAAAIAGFILIRRRVRARAVALGCRL